MRSEGFSTRYPFAALTYLVLGCLLAWCTVLTIRAEEAPVPAPEPEKQIITPFGREPAGKASEAQTPQEADKVEAEKGDKEAAKVELPPGVVARVNGRDIVVREYADYLLASIGKQKLGEYIDRLLIAAEAQRQGIVVTPEEVDELVESEIDRTIEGIFQGDRDRYLKALDRQGTNIEDRKAELRQRLYYDTLLTKIILKEREIGEDALHQEFERVYGKDGVRYDLRHILVSTGRRTGPDGKVLPPRGVGAARARAESILKEIRGGADFVEEVKKYCDDTYTRQGEGRIPDYRPSLFGPEFHAAVQKLSPEHPISDVVRSPRGFHIIQFLGKQQTKFDDVKATILEDLRRRPPSAKERLDAMARLHAKAEIIR
jgi:parvulin-like peptidyl-prolyl isomerase